MKARISCTVIASSMQFVTHPAAWLAWEGQDLHQAPTGCHDSNPVHATPTLTKAAFILAADLTFWLVPDPTPGQHDGLCVYVSGAGNADPQFSGAFPDLIWNTCQSKECADLPTISEPASGEEFHHEKPLRSCGMLC